MQNNSSKDSEALTKPRFELIPKLCYKFSRSRAIYWDCTMPFSNIGWFSWDAALTCFHMDLFAYQCQICFFHQYLYSPLASCIYTKVDWNDASSGQTDVQVYCDSEWRIGVPPNFEPSLSCIWTCLFLPCLWEKENKWDFTGLTLYREKFQLVRPKLRRVRRSQWQNWDKVTALLTGEQC